MRQWLIDVARRHQTVTYAEARAPFKLRTLEHRHAMDRIGHECLDAGEPTSALRTAMSQGGSKSGLSSSCIGSADQ